MTSTAKARTGETPAARQKRVWDKAAPSYDKQIAFFEKTWFGGGREWLGGRTRGRVLEVAIGTGRNLPHYPAGALAALVMAVVLPGVRGWGGSSPRRRRRPRR